MSPKRRFRGGPVLAAVMAWYGFFILSASCGGIGQIAFGHDPEPAGIVSAATLLRLGIPAALAAGYRLPDTGQQKCYDNSKEIPCPNEGQPFYGQDAQYHGYAPAFKDNGDGTVTDLNTRLVWQQGDSQNADKRDWDAAAAYCESLVLAGKDDWRLPSDRELVSILNYGTYSPVVDIKYFPSCKYDDFYWSDTSYALSNGHAWGVSFHNGWTDTNVKSRNFYVRCVRGGP